MKIEHFNLNNMKVKLSLICNINFMYIHCLFTYVVVVAHGNLILNETLKNTQSHLFSLNDII